ncbi:hypothetical protein F5B17DRAFT_379997 [Nemania serpens]|nr:hypothetical protein F5B17DRAFT_379997 [Nemania serpens]
MLSYTLTYASALLLITNLLTHLLADLITHSHSLNSLNHPPTYTHTHSFIYTYVNNKSPSSQLKRSYHPPPVSLKNVC